MIIKALRPATQTLPPAGPAPKASDQALTPGLATTTVEFLQGTYADGPNWNNRLYKAACDMAARGIILDKATPALLSGAAPRSYTDLRQATATIQSAYSNERVPSRF